MNSHRNKIGSKEKGRERGGGDQENCIILENFKPNISQLYFVSYISQAERYHFLLPITNAAKTRQMN